MCGICGCSDRLVGDDHHEHPHAHVHTHEHGHGHEHEHEHEHAHAHGAAEDGEQRRTILIERAILAHNDDKAAANRAGFEQTGVLALNLLSSPGSGKTTLLCETIARLQGRFPTAVIEGDQETSFDADRIHQAGSPAVQVNTGRGCHLDATMIADAVDQLPMEMGAVLFIENVGNLVCPAAFDLGEAARVVLLSVTEGDDKPMKYPDMFEVADLLILTKTDLVPYVPFDVARCVEFARRIHPDLPVIELSAATGQGMEDWLDWISARQGALAAINA